MSNTKYSPKARTRMCQLFIRAQSRVGVAGLKYDNATACYVARLYGEEHFRNLSRRSA